MRAVRLVDRRSGPVLATRAGQRPRGDDVGAQRVHRRLERGRHRREHCRRARRHAREAPRAVERRPHEQRIDVAVGQVRRRDPRAREQAVAAGAAREDAHAVGRAPGPADEAARERVALRAATGVGLRRAPGDGQRRWLGNAHLGTSGAALGDRRAAVHEVDRSVVLAPARHRHLERRRSHQAHARARADRRGDEPARVAAVGRVRWTVEPCRDADQLGRHVALALGTPARAATCTISASSSSGRPGGRTSCMPSAPVANQTAIASSARS
jgi:hypothetical protein